MIVCLLNRLVAPGLVEAQIKFSNFERRQQNLDAAESIFVSALSSASSETRAFVTMQYARFLEKVRKFSCVFTLSCCLQC
jgi:hypothetical protein